MKVKVNGKVWHLEFTYALPKDADGICDAPDEPSKRIRIRKSLTGEAELDTVIHELMHAAHWQLSEEAVNDTARDIARVLWRLGYRRDK